MTGHHIILIYGILTTLISCMLTFTCYQLSKLRHKLKEKDFIISKLMAICVADSKLPPDVCTVQIPKTRGIQCSKPNIGGERI